MRLIQLTGSEGRRVAVVDGEQLRLLGTHRSVYELAMAALGAGLPLAEAAEKDIASGSIGYPEVYSGDSPWRILPAIDHPREAANCMVSGTGLSHIRSAANRQAMHAAGEQATDSMRMYQWGVEGGRPAPGVPGVSPEWFYKGTGDILRAHNEPLDVPSYADDGGEEPEIAGVYIIDPLGNPRSIGMAAGNEFSDHKLEKKNYLYLAASKLRTCAIGPELVLDPRVSPGHAATWRSCAAASLYGRKRFRLASRSCATAGRTSSIIISSSKRIAGPAIFTFTSSERTPSASVRASSLRMET